MSEEYKDPYVANAKRGLYWCNGKNITCNKTNCYLNYGGCFCTHDPAYKEHFNKVFDSEKRVNQYNSWNDTNGGKKIFVSRDSGIIVPK